VARHSLSSFAVLWQRHERLYIEVFSSALQVLTTKEITLDDEDAISEILCIILNQVCFELGQSRNIEVRTPVWEGPIQPVVADELKGGKIRKRPDFNCKCSNRFALFAEEHEIPLHVECKRLGDSSSSSWNLSKNYVDNGTQRFDSITHEYGKRAPSGLMIGYIVGMTPETILTKVNGYQKKSLPSNPAMEFDFGDGNLFTSLQPLTRKHVLPERFKLIHLWVDLNKSVEKQLS